MPTKRVVSDIPELTSLRIIAALCVVISHLSALGIVSAGRFQEIVDGGRPAVSFFFVLSGFIMNHRYPRLSYEDRAAMRRYAQSRFARLYPTLMLSLAIAFPTVIYLVSTHATVDMFKFYSLKGNYGLWLPVSALAQILCATGWIPAAAINQPWNGPAWSLCCEFFFYALFPFFRPLLQRQSSVALVSWAVVGWTAQGLWIIAIHSLVAPSRAGFLIYQFPITHLYEFFLGITAGILFGRLSRRQVSALVVFAGVCSILMFSGVRIFSVSMPAYYAQSPLFAAVILFVSLASGTIWLAPLRHSFALALGHASYALYMIHMPVLVTAEVLGLGVVIGWFWLPALAIASYFVHYNFAEPVRHRLLRRARPNL